MGVVVLFVTASMDKVAGEDDIHKCVIETGSS